MQDLSREDYNYLNEFLTLEAFREHKYRELKELMSQIRVLEAGVRKICRVDAEISSKDYNKYEKDVKQIDEMKTAVRRLSYLDFQFRNYFGDRC